MRKIFLAFFIFLGPVVWAKDLGIQYDYRCESEDGKFIVQVITQDGNRTSATVDGTNYDPSSLRFDPRLGAKNTRLYFLGAPGEDEQYISCELKYTNAQ